MRRCLGCALLLVALGGGRVDACTGVYVGRKASASGATLLCRTVDTPPTTRLFRNVVRERVENAPGRVCTGFHGFSWPLPATTYKYVCTPAAESNRFGDFASLGINEKGLAVSATVTGYSCEGIRTADPFVTEGLSEDSMTGLIAASCATAREAVELIAAVMAKAGGREGNIIMLADPDEAWYVETYSGHQWAALKMPEDKVAAFGNEYTIRAFDPSAPDVRCSPDLVAMPEKAGLLVRAKDAPIDVFRTYGGKAHADFAHLRTWYAHRRLAPEGTVGAYARELDLPQFFAPAHPIAADEVFELMRSRNEGTEWDPDVTRRQDVRIIGTEMQCTCHVVEVRDDVPAPMACTAWFCLGAAEHSVFLPVSALVTATDPDFTRDSRPGATNDWDAAMASAHFRRLAAFAEQDRVFYGRGVRDYWRACERALLAAEPSVREEAVRLYREDPVRAADYLTRRACDLQRAALADAKTAFDSLAWYVTRQNSTCRYSHNYHTHVLTPFKPQKPFEVASGRLIGFLKGR